LETVSSLAATWGRIRFEDHGFRVGLGVLYGDGSTLTWARSYDDGKSFQDVTDMGDGSFGDYDEGANGLKWDFKLMPNSSGSSDVWSQIRDAQLAVVRAWWMTTLTGVDEAPIAVRESYASDGAWRIGVGYFVGGVFTVKYSSDGISFS
jgi:hypothetical protein